MFRKFQDMLTARCGGPIRVSAKHKTIKRLLSYIDAISAMDNMTKNMPKQTARNIQIPPAVPPLLKEMPTITSVYSQVLPRMTAYLEIS
jgi:hypothetical protein